MTKPHVSTTQLEMHTICGERYRRRYVLGEKIPPGVALVRGGSAHKGREHSLKAKLAHGELPPIDEVLAVAADKVDHEFAEDLIVLAGEFDGLSQDRARDLCKDQVVTLARLDYQANHPSLQPARVEERLRAELPDYPVDLVGIIDLIEIDDTIRDLKTGSKRLSAGDVAGNLQLTMYGFIFRLTQGRLASAYKIDQLVHKKRPESVTHTTTRDKADFEALACRLEAMLVAIEKQVWLPCPANHWACSARWCGFYATCRYTAAGCRRPRT